ncbi:MAG: hypothetical protein KKH68_04990 [Proteobacteria bacterium]|nr:hypothetical protein [Pseudomonadota bacterium]
MIKFFIQYYNIPTRKDIDKLMAKLDRLEMLIKTSDASVKGQRETAGKALAAKTPEGRSAMTSSDMALKVIKPYKKGIGFAEIKAKTGFGEKKLRNIIFRLNKMGKIVRQSRGVYTAS